MELLKDLKATLWDRVNSQVFGVYLLTWITYNYDITLTLINNQKHLDDKIIFLNEKFTDVLTTGTYWMPLVLTFLILLIYPALSLVHIRWMKVTTKWKSDLYKEFESLANKEELEELRLEHEKEIEQKGKTYEYNKESLKTRHIEELGEKDKRLNEINKISAQKNGQIAKLTDEISEAKKLLENEKKEFARVNSKTGLDFEHVRELCMAIVEYRDHLSDDLRPDLAIESILKILPNNLTDDQKNTIWSQSEELMKPYIDYNNSKIEGLLELLFNQSSETKYENIIEMKSIREKISDTSSIVDAKLRSNPLDSIRLGQEDSDLTERLSVTPDLKI